VRGEGGRLSKDFLTRERRRNRRSPGSGRGRRWLLLAVCGYVAVTLVHQQIQLADLNAQKHEILRRIESLRSYNDELAEEVANLQDKDYIEKVAREQLGLMKKGEVPIITVPAGPAEGSLPQGRVSSD